jgi:hypothetical protein
LVSREVEMARLRAALDRAVSGEPAVMLRRRGGIGKSPLVLEFADCAVGAGGLALVGGCLDVREGVLPYAPVTKALKAIGRRDRPGGP